jgi:N-glycosylase/DNA lyase
VGSARILLDHPYALEATLFSGQAFRWRQAGGTFTGIVGGAPVTLRAAGGAIDVSGPDAERRADEVEGYLRTSDPMAAIYRSIGTDESMAGAIGRWRGLHLLRQEPWETTASFIVSSASNIPRITRTLDAICARFGKRAARGPPGLRSFPPPAVLAKATPGSLAACGLGYRARYLSSAARCVAHGEISFEDVARLPTPAARDRLVEALDGVGPKVAECILLFSLGKDDAFPVDRWVQRAVADRYLGGQPLAPAKVSAWGREHFGRWAGYAQQYLFQDGRTKAGAAGRGGPRSPLRSQ